MRRTIQSIVVALLFTVTIQSIQAQVGINAGTPQATLDVREVDPANPTSDAGIAVPQVSTLPLGGNRAGQLVINSAEGAFYFYDGSTWQALVSPAHNVGDIKHGFQVVDHDGWVMLDGRDVGTLGNAQKAAAIQLGFAVNLPDADGVFMKQDATATLGTVQGQNQVTLSQLNMPSYTLTGFTSVDGAHTHQIRTRQDDWVLNTFSGGSGPSYGRDNGPIQITNNTQLAGDHSHTVSIPSGGSDQPVDIDPTYLVVNAFVYLGD